MVTTPGKSRRVTVDLPEEAFDRHRWDPQEVASEMRLLWLIEQVRDRRLSFQKAAELAGIPQARFVKLLGEHHVSPFDYDDDELAREFETE